MALRGKKKGKEARKGKKCAKQKSRRGGLKRKGAEKCYDLNGEGRGQLR